MRIALLAFVSIAASAQLVRVYSEFAQINEKGEVTAPAQPREILSPALVRNGFTSFQIVVQVAPDTPFWLYIGQNPEDAVKVTLYREGPGKLEPVTLPVEGKSTQVFWMDVWTDRDAPVQRIKVEPQLNVNGDWVVYPMEARVMDAVVPDAVNFESHDMREFLCGPYRKNYFGYFLQPRWRNVAQDIAMAAKVPKPELIRLAGSCEFIDSDSERYLKIRDYLFRMR